MDKLLAMRSFVAIIDHGSLTAAAAALDRSLPAMVRTLAALEASLGTRLLRRTFFSKPSPSTKKSRASPSTGTVRPKWWTPKVFGVDAVILFSLPGCVQPMRGRS